MRAGAGRGTLLDDLDPLHRAHRHRVAELACGTPWTGAIHCQREVRSMKITRVALALCVAGLVTVATSSCSKLAGRIVPNLPPDVKLTSAPYDTTGRYFYAYKLSWIGNDPDGRVDYFLYAIHPPLDGRPINWTK